MKKIVVCSLFLAVMACAERKQSFEAEKILHFDVEEFANIDMNNTGKFKQYEEQAAKSLKAPVTSYIPLQTTEECLIGEINKLVCTDKYIYVYDRRFNKLYQFDTGGRFLRQIGQAGEGPDRYVKMCAFDVNSENGNVSIYCEVKSSVIEYSCTGEILKVEKTGLSIDDFVYYKGHYLFYCGRSSNEPAFKDTYPVQYRLVSLHNGKIDRKYLEYRYRNSLSNTVYTANDIGFYRLNGDLMLAEQQTGMVYKIEQNTIVPVYAVDFGKYNIPFDVFSAEVDDSKLDALPGMNFCHLLDFHETGDLIYIRYSVFNNPICQSVYLKKTGETVNLGLYWINDSDNIGMPIIMTASNDALAGYYDADLFRHIVKHKADKVPAHLTEMANGIRDDDNPVICIVRF
ncbi:MAG: 6-bladed beta-propeller [Prevotellaceae bacterium]|jgi:hypothetical protein|nr:6-bladed beta-propeller [Prevotellaceae bacterium]